MSIVGLPDGVRPEPMTDAVADALLDHAAWLAPHFITPPDHYMVSGALLGNLERRGIDEVAGRRYCISAASLRGNLHLEPAWNP